MKFVIVESVASKGLHDGKYEPLEYQVLTPYGPYHVTIGQSVTFGDSHYTVERATGNCQKTPVLLPTGLSENFPDPSFFCKLTTQAEPGQDGFPTSLVAHLPDDSIEEAPSIPMDTITVSGCLIATKTLATILA